MIVTIRLIKIDGEWRERIERRRERERETETEKEKEREREGCTTHLAVSRITVTDGTTIFPQQSFTNYLVAP